MIIEPMRYADEPLAKELIEYIPDYSFDSDLLNYDLPD